MDVHLSGTAHGVLSMSISTQMSSLKSVENRVIERLPIAPVSLLLLVYAC